MALLIAAMAALVVLGVGAIVLALRGRRIDDHPVCRRCRFDLVGMFPGSHVCPECGRTLSERAVRTGNRRRRKGLLAIGVAVLALSLAGGAGLTVASVGGPALNPYKPLWMLRLEAKGSDAKRAGDAVDEIVARYARGELGEKETARLVRLALDEHADASDPNAAQWIGVIESLVVDKRLSAEQFARYIEQGIAINVRVRPRIRAGDPLPLEVVVLNGRFARGRLVYVELEFARFAVDGVAIPPGRSVNGSVAGSGPTPRGYRTAYDLVRVGELSVGEHDLNAGLSITFRSHEGASDPRESRVLAEIERQLSFRFAVAAEDTISVVTPDDAMRERMRSSISAGMVVPEKDGSLQLEIRADNPPTDGVFQVSVRASGSEEWFATEGRLRFTADERMNYGMSTSNLPKVFHATDRIDIRLTPDPDGARKTVAIEGIYGEEIVIEDVSVQRSG